MPDSLLCTNSQSSLRKAGRRPNPFTLAAGSPAPFWLSGAFHQSDSEQPEPGNPEGQFRGQARATHLTTLEQRMSCTCEARLRTMQTSITSLSQPLAVLEVNPPHQYPGHQSGGHTLLLLTMTPCASLSHTYCIPDGHTIYSHNYSTSLL